MQNLLRNAFPSNSVLNVETLKDAARRSRLYIIFLTPRSGSTWLTELAMRSGVLGTPQEWFNDQWIYTSEPALGCLPPRLRDITDVNDYVNAIVDEGRGTAGLQLSIFQALMLAEMLNGGFDPVWLAASVYLRRRDRVAQAVSLYRSVSSGRFHSYQNKPTEIEKFNNVTYNYDRILQWLQFLIDCEEKFETMFRRCGFSPIPIFYEDLQSNPLDILRQIALGVGVTPPIVLPTTSLEVVRDDVSSAWRDRFINTYRLTENIL